MATNSNDFSRAETIIAYYVKVYNAKHGSKPIVNRNKVKFSVIDMLKDINMTEAKKVIDFYMLHYLKPEITELVYKYDEIIVEMNDEDRDKKLRKDLLSETERNVKMFRERYKNS